ncbi:MAG: hypothetical protein ACXWXS_01255 [Actinomycetota bacterium]
MERRQGDDRPIEEPASSDTRHIQRTERRSILGGVIGLVAGLLIAVTAGILNFDALGAIAACGLAGAIAGLAIGVLTGGMSSLESPAPGYEPSGTDRPRRDVPALTSEERDSDRHR